MWSSSCVTSYRKAGGRTPPPEGNDIGGLQITTPLGLPYSNRLVLHYIEDTSGNLCEAPYTDCDRNAEPWVDLVYRDTGTVRLQNTSGGALQLSLSVGRV